mmetsp:Transcript_42595/g.129290  ORF Transcript_42595/g.129290 Transcript_42595/m.129290 type:complete len:163 (+) Transcript_42595:904-1392(+)
MAVGGRDPGDDADPISRRDRRETGDGCLSEWGNCGPDSWSECGVPTHKQFVASDKGDGVLRLEHNLGPGSERYAWLEQDLSSVHSDLSAVAYRGVPSSRASRGGPSRRNHSSDGARGRSSELSSAKIPAFGRQLPNCILPFVDGKQPWSNVLVISRRGRSGH